MTIHCGDWTRDALEWRIRRGPAGTSLRITRWAAEQVRLIAYGEESPALDGAPDTAARRALEVAALGDCDEAAAIAADACAAVALAAWHRVAWHSEDESPEPAEAATRAGLWAAHLLQRWYDDEVSRRHEAYWATREHLLR